jgi:hypothetical protein
MADSQFLFKKILGDKYAELWQGICYAFMCVGFWYFLRNIHGIQLDYLLSAFQRRGALGKPLYCGYLALETGRVTLPCQAEILPQMSSHVRSRIVSLRGWLTGVSPVCNVCGVVTFNFSRQLARERKTCLWHDNLAGIRNISTFKGKTVFCCKNFLQRVHAPWVINYTHITGHMQGLRM